MNRKKILVTGGAGFVGSHLCERLAQNSQNEVYSLDNYFTGSTDNHVPGVEYIKGNTSDIDKLVSFRPDIVYPDRPAMDEGRKTSIPSASTQGDAGSSTGGQPDVQGKHHRN